MSHLNSLLFPWNGRKNLELLPPTLAFLFFYNFAPKQTEWHKLNYKITP